MSPVKHAVIAAAGLGSRLGHGKPKCLVEIEGITILAQLLSRLSDVEDVRVVVGFEEKAVMAELKRIRPDAIAVRNPNFRSTTTLHSYAAGAKYLDGDCLFLDGDLLLEPESFKHFIDSCRPNAPKLGITKAKTRDAVYVTIEDEKVTAFDRLGPAEFEWANVAWLPIEFFKNIEDTSVYQHLYRFLPLGTKELVSYEVDTEEDLLQARENSHLFGMNAGA